MARALILLAFVAVACVLGVHAEQAASPAKELQDALNGLQDTILTDPIQSSLDANDVRNEELYEERLNALKTGGASWTAAEADAHDLSLAESGAESGMEADLEAEAGVDATAGGPSTGKILKEGLVDMVAKGLISSDIGKRILAINAEKQPAKPKGKGKGKKKGKKGKGKKGGKPHVEDKANSGATKPSNVKGVDGKPVKSLQLVTGTNAHNSHCFACQYFVQRLLGALLGPFYSPKNAGPHIPKGYRAPKSVAHTAEPLTRHKQYVASATAFEALDRSKKSKQNYNKHFMFNPFTPGFSTSGYPYIFNEAAADVNVIPAEEIAAIEVFAVVTENFPEPSLEESVEQYSKWEPFLPEHHRFSLIEAEAEAETEVDADVDVDVDVAAGKKAGKKAKKGKGKKAKKGKGKGKPKPSAKSLRSKFGKLFNRYQDHAVEAYFSDICNRRVPVEWKPVCQTLYKNLAAVTEELATGDRADEVCTRVKLCTAKSYMAKRTHTAIRAND